MSQYKGGAVIQDKKLQRAPTPGPVSSGEPLGCRLYVGAGKPRGSEEGQIQDERERVHACVYAMPVDAMGVRAVWQAHEARSTSASESCPGSGPRTSTDTPQMNMRSDSNKHGEERTRVLGANKGGGGVRAIGSRTC